MARTVQFNAGQRLNIVIDDIIFLRRGADAAPERSTIGTLAPQVVIDDIIFLKLQEGDTIPLSDGGVESTDTVISMEVRESSELVSTRSESHGRPIVLDPNECFLELVNNTLVIRKWVDDNGIKRKLFEQYALRDLASLTVVRDESSGRLVFNLYTLERM